MAPKYPKFKSELDLDALEILVTNIVEVLDRHMLSAHEAAHLEGLLVRCSPYFRQKIGGFGPEIMAVAHYEGWDGND